MDNQEPNQPKSSDGLKSNKPERSEHAGRTYTRRKLLVAAGLLGAGAATGAFPMIPRSDASGNPHGKIGDLSMLSTEEKTNLVAAINEQHAQINTIESDLLDRGINVKYPPAPLDAAVGDGVTDDTSALQAIADYAKLHNKILFIPDGSYLVTHDLSLYTSVVCLGEIITPNGREDTLLHIARTKPSQTISGTLLSGLHKNSTHIQGLEGLKGATVSFHSTELLIRRTPPAEGTYLKKETSVINDSDGQITPALDFTYTNPNQLTAYIYPQEPPLLIDGLRIRTIGDTQGSRTMINCVRSDVLFRNLVIENSSQETVLERGVGIVNACNVTFEHANIRGFAEDTSLPNLGYGVSVSESATVTFINCNINDCRHAISGRFGKNVKVFGGTYSQDIDTHWGNNWTVDGATFVTNRDVGVNYCGTDITITNCSFYGGVRMILAIRNDTPELDGAVIVKNNRFYSDTTWVRLVGFPGQNNTYNNFGKVLENPKYVLIEGNYIEAPSGVSVTLLHAGGVRGYAQTYWGDVVISRNYIRNGNPLTAIYLSVNEDVVTPNNRRPSFSIEQQIFNNSSTSTTYNAVWLVDRTPLSGVTSAGLCADVRLIDCQNVHLDISPSIVSRVSLIRCFVSRVVTGSAGHEEPVNGEYYFSECVFQNCAFLYRAPSVFISSVFEGTSSGADLQDNAILTLNNVAKIGATNFPTPLHGKKDSSVYQ